MHWLYTALLFSVFFGCFAMMIREGIWSNTLTLFNVLFSGLLAFSLYGPITIWFDELLDGEYTYLLDFLSLWIIFSISMVLLRLCTDFLSRTRVRFKKPVEAAGGPIVALITAWLMVGIVSATMHAAPLPRGYLGDAIVVEDESDVEGALNRPHMHWLLFAGGRIMGLGSNDAIDSMLDEFDKIAIKPGYKEFIGDDLTSIPLAEYWARMFVIQYQNRRAQFEKADGMRVKRG